MPEAQRGATLHDRRTYGARPRASVTRNATERPQLPDVAAIERWLSAFAAAVRARDYAAGRALFDENVVAFGTRASAVAGLDQLVVEQWSHVWDRTRGFAFDPEGGHVRVDGDVAWAAVGWRSEGWTSAAGSAAGGRWFGRRGRTTFVFRRDRGRSPAGWLAVHSHFSLDPAEPAAALDPLGRAAR